MGSEKKGHQQGGGRVLGGIPPPGGRGGGGVIYSASVLGQTRLSPALLCAMSMERMASVYASFTAAGRFNQGPC
jgi:hypothetical protein